MTDSITRYEFEALQVIGYLVPPRLTIPRPVQPVYRLRRDHDSIVLPCGAESTAREFLDRTLSGEAGYIGRPQAARSDRFLWLDITHHRCSCSGVQSTAYTAHYSGVGRNQLLRLARARWQAVQAPFKAQDFRLPRDTDRMQAAVGLLVKTMGDLDMIDQMADHDHDLFRRTLDYWSRDLEAE